MDLLYQIPKNPADLCMCVLKYCKEIYNKENWTYLNWKQSFIQLLKGDGGGYDSNKDDIIFLEVDGKLCGILLAARADSIGAYYVSTLEVVKECRGNGFGTELLKKAYSRSLELGWGRLKLQISEEEQKHELVDYYRKRGFRIDSKLDDFGGNLWVLENVEMLMEK